MKKTVIILSFAALICSLSFAQQIGDSQRNGEQKQNSDDARARAEKVMRDADKLTDEQFEELFNIVFPKNIDWDVSYEAFLKENPGIAKAVNSGKISKEKVIAGIKSRAGEKAPTEAEQIEALYQRLLKDEPALGRTAKAELMPRLKAMLERGEAKNLRPEKSTRQRVMTFGLYLNGLIESGQVERFDKDLKRVHDLGVAEIGRQGRQDGQGQDGDRNVASPQEAFRAKLGEFVRAGKLTREEAGELFKIAFPETANERGRERRRN